MDANLPLPVAALLRRARNAKSPRDRHDTAYYAWEASIRLAVATRPPAEAAALARPTAGQWVAAFVAGAPAGDGSSHADREVLDLYAHLAEVGGGRRKAPQSVTARELLDALVAYRNKVIGHGGAPQGAQWYAAGADLLTSGLLALWAAGCFLGAGARVAYADGVEEDAAGRRRVRLLELRASGPEILDPDGTPDVPPSVLKGHVVVHDGTRWTTLFPWVLYRAERESVLFYNSSARQAEYLDFASGTIERGTAVEEFAPGAAAEAEARTRVSSRGRVPQAGGAAARDGPALGASPVAVPAGEPAQGGVWMGRTVGGQFHVLRTIAESESGGLYEARDVSLERRVALKLMPVALAKNQAQIDRFFREARTAARLVHPNLVAVHSFGLDEEHGVYFLALEHVEGRTLQDLIDEHGPLPVADAIDYVIQACRGLGAAHGHRIIHRDVKPASLLLTTTGVVKVTDFGLAKMIEAEAGPQSTVIGTPSYMAPEQFEGRTRDGRTDVYSLGATLYHALTGQRPHGGAGPAQVLLSAMTTEPKSIVEIRPELPTALWGVVRRMLDRDPERRYATCEEVVEALAPIARTAAGPEDDDPARFGDFELLGKLGEGGMGVVFLARQRSLDRVVALKMATPAASGDAVSAARFRREMSALSRCDHPNVVKILASGEERGRLWFAMEYVEGADLAAVAGVLSGSAGLDDAVSSASEIVRAAHKDTFDRVPRLPRVDVRLAPRRSDLQRELAQAMLDAALGLDHLHACGILHRDVKPGNLMLTPERRVVVMDLGLAAVRDASRTLSKDKTSILGTLRYMPPEQLQRGLLQVDERSDVYALGATFYELLTERPMFEAADERALIASVLRDEPVPPRKANAQLSEDLATIVSKCIAKDARDRYRSMRAVADDLAAYLEGRPIAARPASFGYYVRLAVRRNPVAAGAIGLIAAVLVASLVVVVGLLEESRQATAHAEDANRAKDVALTRARATALASASQAARVSRPMRALLLAREAARADPSPFVVAELRASLIAAQERRYFAGHEGHVIWVEVSPDRRHVLTAGKEGTARLWSIEGRPLVVFGGHDGWVLCARFSPDGSRVLTSCSDGSVRVWGIDGRQIVRWDGQAGLAAYSADGSHILTRASDGTPMLRDADGRPLARFDGHGAAVSGACFAPDGLRVLTFSVDKTVRVWDLKGTELRRIEDHGVAVDCAAFAPDGVRIATGSPDGTARIWDADGGCAAVLQGHQGGVLSVLFAPDGSHLLTTSRDGTIRTWTGAGAPVGVCRASTRPVGSAVFSPDGLRLAAVTLDGAAIVWNLTGDVATALRGHESEVLFIAFAADAESVVTGSLDCTARIWAIHPSERAALPGHGGAVYSAVFAPDGSRILTASRDATARLWTPSGTPLAVLGGHKGAVTSAEFAPDGTRILTTSADGTARLWDAEGRVTAVLEGHAKPIYQGRFSPDGARVVTASEDGTARIWLSTGARGAVLQGHGGAVYSAMFSPDGTRIVTASADKTARVWDLSGAEAARLTGHGERVTGAEFSPDGTTISTVSQDLTARLWDLAGRETAKLAGPRNWPFCASFSPDGTRIATAADDKMARLWDTAGRQIAPLIGHESSVLCATFSPDGSSLLTSSGDGTARVWDLSGRQTALLDGHRRDVYGASFSPDGRWVVTAGADATARVWCLRTGDLLAAADERVSRDFLEGEIAIYGDLLSDETKARARKALESAK